jgi:hypothetical protein
MPLTDGGLYVFEDVAFVNTSLFTEAADHYRKFGKYTKAPKGSREHKEFWDIEEDRRRNGMSAPGKLYYENGVPKMQKVNITGVHYGFLNYGRILLTEESDEKEIKHLTGNKLKNERKVGKKKMDFPRFIDGQYHYLQYKKFASEVGKNTCGAKARRKGFSYLEGFECADTINLNPYVTVLVAAYDYKYILLGNQILPMAKRCLDWFELETDFTRHYLKESPEHIKLGFKKPSEGNKEFGYRSELIGVSCANNPDAPAGKDAILVKFEECGKFANLKESLDITMSTVEDGSYTTGRLDMWGTGGTKDANWADFEEIYYNPDSYNILACDNIWDEGALGTGVGIFYPQSLGDPAFLDEYGNSLRDAAKANNDKLRLFNKTHKSQSEYIRYIGQRAECPKEAFSSGSDNIFPSAEILDQLNKIEHDPDFKYLAREGVLVRTEKGVKFKHNSDFESGGHSWHPPVNNFPLKSGSDVNGCYVEWISPFRNPGSGDIPKGLYRVWNDPYAHDKDSKDIKVKDSLGATYVYERINNITPGGGDYLVAAYIGRPSTIDEYNENLLKICEYWNAEVMFENDRGDVKGYFTRQRKGHLMANEPDLEWEAELKGKTGRGKGMHMTDGRKGMGAIYYRDWLMTKRGTDKYGNPKLNLHYIYDPALLRETLKWNVKGNFDRVSSLLIGMYDMKECFNREIKAPRREDPNDFFNRPLFTNS